MVSRLCSCLASSRTCISVARLHNAIKPESLLRKELMEANLLFVDDAVDVLVVNSDDLLLPSKAVPDASDNPSTLSAEVLVDWP